MTLFDISRRAAELTGQARVYDEFLRVPALSAGLYRLAAGAVDPQQPHAEDEVYYVLSGRGKIRVGDEDREVTLGTLVFVPARVEHRFHSIMDDLTLLVLFAPAETLPEAVA